jgi:hypothetical protein
VKAMKNDVMLKRVAAFAKRLLQVCFFSHSEHRSVFSMLPILMLWLLAVTSIKLVKFAKQRDTYTKHLAFYAMKT